MKILFYLFIWLACMGNLAAQFPTDGLVAYYALDGNVVDSTAEAVDGQIVGNVIPGPNRFGEADRAMFFDGNSYVEIETTEKFQIQEAITIALWINPSSVSTDGWTGLFNKWQDLPGPNTGGLGYYVGLNPNGVRLRWNSGAVQGDGSRIYPDEWIHIAVTYDTDSLRIYRDGKQEFARVAQGPMQRTNTVPVRMGSQSEELDNNIRYHGYMDEVLVYDRALSAAEIQQIYQGPTTQLVEIAEVSKAEVFPNPCQEEVWIKWPLENEPPQQAVLYDLLGKPIRQFAINSTATPIPLGNLPSGIYLLSLSDKNQQQTIRLVKE